MAPAPPPAAADSEPAARERPPGRQAIQWQLAGEPAGLVAIGIAYLLLATWYSTATPPLEAGDERPQFLAVRHIANGNGLPILDPSDTRPDSPSQEAGQPPLFHLLASLLIADLDTDDVLTLKVNPHALVGIPSTDPGNKNRVIHPPNEAELQSVAAVRRVRLFSIALGLLAVVGTYLLARQVVADPAAAFLAAALVAFNPMFLFVSASVANDSAIAALSTLALVLLIPSLRGEVSLRRSLGQGALVGAAALTKLSGLALLPIGAAIIGLAAQKRAGWKEATRQVAVLGAAAVLVAGWWYARNLTVYGEPTGLSAWLQVSGVRTEPFRLDELQGVWLGFWGVFGAFDILAQPWTYAVYAVLCAGALAGWIRLIRRTDDFHVPGLVLLAVWLLVEGIALARWTSLNLASSGRLLFPAIASVAVILAAGLILPLAGNRRAPAAFAAGALLSSVAALIPVQSLAPAYAPAPMATEADVTAAPLHPDIRFSQVAELAGAVVAPVTAPGSGVAITLIWRALQPSGVDYSLGVHLVGRDGVALGQIDAYPGQGRYPTSFWKPGDLVRDDLVVPVQPGTQIPTTARVTVSMYQLETRAALDAIDSRGVVIYPALVGASELRSAEDPPCPQPIPGAEFGGSIRLVRTSEIPSRARAGDAIPITLTWCTDAPASTNYTAFVHLATTDEPPVAQHDGPPRAGRYPTSAWARGEQVPDERLMLVPATVPAGSYRLQVGLYDPSTSRRARTPDGRDSVELGRIEILPPRAAAP